MSRRGRLRHDEIVSMMSAEGSNGFAIELEVLDRLPPVFSEIGSGLGTARGRASTASAATTGSEALTAELQQFGSLLSAFLGQALADNQVDQQRVAFVREGYSDIDQTNLLRAIRTDQRLLRPLGVSELLGRVTDTPGVPSLRAAPVQGRVDRVQPRTSR